MPEYYSVEWMDHVLFVHWSTNVHSGYFHLSDCEQSCPPSCFEFIHLGIVIWELHLRKPMFSDFSVLDLRSNPSTVVAENTCQGPISRYSDSGDLGGPGNLHFQWGPTLHSPSFWYKWSNHCSVRNLKKGSHPCLNCWYIFFLFFKHLPMSNIQ